MTKSDVSSADEGYFMKKIYKKKSAKKNNFKCDFAETKIKGFSSNFLVGLSLTYCCMQNFNQKIIMVIKLLSMVFKIFQNSFKKKIGIQSTIKKLVTHSVEKRKIHSRKKFVKSILLLSRLFCQNV